VRISSVRIPSVRIPSVRVPSVRIALRECGDLIIANSLFEEKHRRNGDPCAEELSQRSNVDAAGGTAR
jgi:hypothetical protein